MEDDAGELDINKAIESLDNTQFRNSINAGSDDNKGKEELS